MQTKQNHPVYKDGVLEYGEITTIYDNAKKKIGESFAVVEKLMFENMSRREQDYLLANTLGKTLDLKVKVPFRKLETDKKIRINNLIYDIYKIDEDDFNTYVYLQAVEK